MLTIRDHVLLGHYPTNDRGFALVPMRPSFGIERIATVVTAHGPAGQELMGWYGELGDEQTTCWTAAGAFDPNQGKTSLDLMPPVTRMAVAADLGIPDYGREIGRMTIRGNGPFTIVDSTFDMAAFIR